MQWLFCFALKFTDFSDNIDQQEFFRPFGLFGLGLLDLGPEFFSGVRTPALNDYASRRPSCLLESVGRLYQSSFIFYTGPQSHYEGVGLENIQPDMSSENLHWLLSQEKPLMGLTQKSC